MMEELTAQKVNKWLFWLMLAIFVLITYLNFYQLVHRTVGFVLALPFWFMLTAGLLGSFFVLNLISKGAHELEELEEELYEQREGIVALERSFRLVRQDPYLLPPLSFKRYCADVLRQLDFARLQEASADLKGVQFLLTDKQGQNFFVACVGGTEPDLRGAIHQLYYQMLQKGMRHGLILTAAHVDGPTKTWARSLAIDCLNVREAIQVTHSILENA